MDNIRLALKDINLTDEISAADLYAEILDSKSESKLMLALLRHDVTNPSIQEEDEFEHYGSEYQWKIINIIIVMAFIFVAYIGLLDGKNMKAILKDIINITIIILLVLSLCEYTFYDIFDSHYQIKSLILVSIIVIMAYCIAIYKMRDKIFDLIINLAIIPGIFVGIFGIMYEKFNIEEETIVFISLIVPALMTALIVISRKYKLNKFWTKVKDITIMLVKIAVVYIITAIIADMLYYEELGFIIVLLITYLTIEKIYQRKE